MEGQSQVVIFPVAQLGWRVFGIYNIYNPHPGDHGIRIDLTHVMTAVLLFYVFDVKGPCKLAVVVDIKPMISRDDISTD